MNLPLKRKIQQSSNFWTSYNEPSKQNTFHSYASNEKLVQKYILNSTQLKQSVYSSWSTNDVANGNPLSFSEVYLENVKHELLRYYSFPEELNSSWK